MNATIQRTLYRNGQLREEVPLRNGRRHGVVRTWHRNGVLASEKHYQQDLLHGTCRQWDEMGKLLGSYEMIHGAGVEHVWFDDGHLQQEQSFVNGLATGRWRSWLQDGSLASEQWLIENHEVSRAEYLKAAASHADWPKYLSERRQQRRLSPREIERRAFRLHCDWLSAKATTREAAGWLDETNNGARNVGALTSEQARKIISQALAAGARGVLAADIYRSKEGREFCDVVLVRLPKTKAQRTAIRRLFGSLPRGAHCAVQPDKDSGESWLYAYFG